MPMTHLGAFIRERRIELGLSQEDLAERIGPTVRRAEISRLERGNVVLPRRGRLERIAAALDVSLGTLLLYSEWLTEDERDELDASPTHAEDDRVVLHGELVEVREVLQLALARLKAMEQRIPVEA